MRNLTKSKQLSFYEKLVKHANSPRQEITEKAPKKKIEKPRYVTNRDGLKSQALMDQEVFFLL